MEPGFAPLTISTTPLQRSRVERALRSSDIHFLTREGVGGAALFGAGAPDAFLEFHVPAEKLDAAKAALRSEGIICELTAHHCRRTMDDIVRPLLSHDVEPDFGRLIRFVELNNEETVEALFEATFDLKGGGELLEHLFFQMAKQGTRQLEVLARALTTKTTASFSDRYQSNASVGEDAQRVALLAVVSEFSSCSWYAGVLATGLLDRDSVIRDAATKSLFALKGEDCGYDPEDPPAEREAAVQEILRVPNTA